MNSLNDFFRKHALFLVWGPPSYGPRSKVLTRELGLGGIHFIYSTTRRGPWIAPLKYTYQALKTMEMLIRERPKLVFVQSPPSFAVILVYLYCVVTGNKFIVDAHSAALLKPYWQRPGWLARLWTRAAITTIVTNEHFQKIIRQWGGHGFVLRDIPTNFELNGAFPMNGKFSIVVVNTFSGDEPLSEVLEASKALPEIQFYVTGKKERGEPKVIEEAPANVRFTDFLPDESYYSLLSNSKAVMCLTTRDHTMQRGACEALSLGVPIITSDWPLLREYFNKGAVHVPNTQEGISLGVQTMVNDYDQYKAGIKALQSTQQREWQEKVAALLDLIREEVL